MRLAVAAEPAAARAAMEALARKQHQAALVAMQASLDKQRASVESEVSAAIGRQAPKADTGTFFNLPPLTPAPSAICQPVPETEVAPIVLDAAQREGLEPRLLTAVIQQESAFRPCAVSQKGALGLMQLMPATAGQFGVDDPFDARQNVDAGARFLKELLARYGGNLKLALGAYNAGPDRVDQAGGVPPIPETTAYVSEILSRLAAPPPSPKPPSQ